MTRGRELAVDSLAESLCPRVADWHPRSVAWVWVVCVPYWTLA